MAQREERSLRRHERLNRIALTVFALGPLSGIGSAAALSFLGLSTPLVVATGIFTLAFTWGFLGSISLVTTEGVERAEALAEERRALRSARIDPGHGQLSLGSTGSLALHAPEEASGDSNR